jgi:hypothetical protein
VGRVIELRKTLIGALNPISEGEGNTASCATFASNWSALRSLRAQAR